MGVLLLAVGPEDVTHDEEVKLVGVTASFLFEGMEGDGREGAFAGQKQATVLGGKEVVELGLSETEGGLAFGSKSSLPDLELGGLFGLEGDFDQFLVSEGFQRAFEGGGGDVGRVAEVVIAHATRALPASEMPEAQVHRLFGGAQIREHRREQVGKIHGLGIAWKRGQKEKGRARRSCAGV